MSLEEARERRNARQAVRSRTGQRAAREAQATEWRRQLAAGEVASRADLARREGVSRAWVTKVLLPVK